MTPVSRSWSGPAELLQTAAIARRYYFENKSKSELAAEFGLSRFKIARVLDDALATGVVQIVVSLPADLDVELSGELSSAYGLRHTLVVRNPEGEDASSLTARLGQAGAQLLADIIAEGEVLGIPSGRTMTSLANHLTHLAPCTAVPLTGVLTIAESTETVVELLRHVTTVSGGSAYPLYAPWVVSDDALARRIRQEPDVADVLRRHDYLTTALVAVGSWEPPDSTLFDCLSGGERDRLRAQGIAAEVCGILLDVNGRIVRTPLSDRLIAITAERLVKVPHVVAVAGGSTKHRAIQAVLRAEFVHSLVTDSDTARFLLEQRR